MIKVDHAQCMTLLAAEHMGRFVVAKLAPYCERIEVAGSTRRKCPMVHDLEIVCIPHRELPDLRQASLFDDVDLTKSQWRPTCGFVSAVEDMEPVKGNAQGKYTRRIVQGFPVDIFMVRPETWALQLLIRTGSADFVHYQCAKRWTAMGYHSVDAILTHGSGKVMAFKEESDVFEFLGLGWIPPEQRI